MRSDNVLVQTYSASLSSKHTQTHICWLILLRFKETQFFSLWWHDQNQIFFLLQQCYDLFLCQKCIWSVWTCLSDPLIVCKPPNYHLLSIIPCECILTYIGRKRQTSSRFHTWHQHDSFRCIQTQRVSQPSLISKT